jgi:AraC-like DNA-binding protein/quercetin dioxygenase-like cupin family protein
VVAIHEWGRAQLLGLEQHQGGFGASVIESLGAVPQDATQVSGTGAHLRHPVHRHFAAARAKFATGHGPSQLLDAPAPESVARLALGDLLLEGWEIAVQCRLAHGGRAAADAAQQRDRSHDSAKFHRPGDSTGPGAGVGESEPISLPLVTATQPRRHRMNDPAFDMAPGTGLAPRPPGAAAPPALAATGFAQPPANDRLRRELVPHDTGCAITVRRFVNARFDYPWHYHPELELSLVVSGSGLRHVGDSIEAFGPGDLVLVGSGIPHCWLSTPTAARTDAAIVLQFSPDAFGGAFLGLLETRPIALLLRRAALGLHFDGAPRDAAATILQTLTRPGITRLEKLSGLISLLTELAAAGGGRALALTEGHPCGARESSRAAEVLRYIRQHAAERISRPEVARLAGMSSGTFSRFFARQFGKPFVAYVAEVRIANACRLLREHDQSVSGVAHEVGFTNLANFNRTFLRLKGMTPSAYRKMARSAV